MFGKLSSSSCSRAGQPHQNVITFEIWKRSTISLSVPDPRMKGRCKHKLSDILIIAIATYLCGGDDYASMYEFCKHRGESLKPLVELPNGCPSVDTTRKGDFSN